jgi:glycine/D-amino acid oxidase-like deaminating enzyme
MTRKPDRRFAVLGGLGALSACAGPGETFLGPPAMDLPPRLAPIRAHKDRLFDITVCLRPFRAAGPRLDTEVIGDALVVHNYGHGGSGWSLSWGSATLALEKAMSRSPRQIAVIGCGALGLTAATLALRAGIPTTIYCKELIQQARSARASGLWTPDSRIAMTRDAAPGFGDRWERMARTSWKTWRGYLGLPGDPVLFRDRYLLSDGHDAPEPDQGFAGYAGRIADLTPRSVALAPEWTPFAVEGVRRTSTLQFNVHDLGHQLLTDIHAMGGKVVRREFHSPAEFAQLREKVVINCTGYGARDLMGDDSIVPVRGQIGWLIPQPEVTYGLYYRDVSVVSRSDGIMVQALEGGDLKGFNDANETPERAESEAAVDVIADLYSRFRS